MLEKISFKHIMLNKSIDVINYDDTNRMFLDFCIFFINANQKVEDISIDEIEIEFVLNENFDKTIKSLCNNEKERYDLFLLNIKKIIYYGYLVVLKPLF